jgi:geranylgeranyl diphosphate synthase type II
VGNATQQQTSALEAYGKHFGLAFQIIDDILDLTSKDTGKSSTDAQNKKLTYPSIYGIDKSLSIAKDLTEKAKQAVAGLFPEKGTRDLFDLADYNLVRKK